MLSTLVRLALAGLLITPPAAHLSHVDQAPGFALFVGLVLVVLFSASLFRTRTEKNGARS